MSNIKLQVSKIVITTGLILSALVIAPKVIGDAGCTPLYGGGFTCPKRGEILIDKNIKHPTKDLFVDNLTQFDPKYTTDQEVTFRIHVANTGNDLIDKVEVKDIMPDFLSFVSGPGNFNQNEGKNGTLTFTIYNLASGERREYWITGKVFSSGSLPENLICKLQNRGQARGNADQFNEDIAEFCVEKRVPGTTKAGVPLTEVPKAGPFEYALTFTALTSIAGVGVYLRRKAQSLIK